MSAIGWLTALAVLTFFPRLSSLLFRAAGVLSVLLATIRIDGYGVDVEGAWLALAGIGLWTVGHIRYRLHKGQWRSRPLRRLADRALPLQDLQQS